MKKVTLLGDSIRLFNYGPRVIELLGEEYEVFSPGDNGRFSKHTQRMIFDEKDKIMGSDVIHWNNGLWDVSDLFGDGLFTKLDEYLAVMTRIAKQLLKMTKRLIFATTTPVREEFEFNDNKDIIAYNEALVPLLKELGVEINDLHATVYPRRAELICDDYIHLNEEGIEVCAKQVVDAIIGK